MKETTTILTSSRYQGLQSFRGAWQRLSMMLLVMMLMTATAWAEEVTPQYMVSCNTMMKETTLTRSNGSGQKATWAFTSGMNENPWNAGATHGVDDEYDITFKPNGRLSAVNNGMLMTSAETKFTVEVGTNAYYIKSVSIGGVTANAGLNAKTLDVTVPSTKTINVLSVTLIRYYTVTPANGLQVTSGTSATSGGTTYYKPGTTVTVAPTNQYHIVEGTGGTGSATATVANDKRSFSFTMPTQNVSPSATLTEVYRMSPASGITLSPAAHFTYGGAQYYKPGTTITLSSTVPTGQHVIYKAGSKTLAGNTYTVNSTDGDVTLTAEYPYNNYTVYFNGNGSTSGSMSNQSFTYGTAQNLTANAFRRTGYTFAGWNTKADGSGTSYDDQKSVNNLTTTNGGTVTLYAQWTANQYTITFDTNGGSAINPITQDYNTAITAPADPTRKGYTFAGWNPALPTTMPAGDMTVTAQWEIVTYTITYNLDGGELPSGQSNPGTYTVETPTFMLNNPIKTGYTFDGWYDNEGLTGTPVTTIDKGSTGVKVLYAKWTVNQYTINFDTNGGSAINPITQDYNTAITAPADPTRKGYTFAGWNPALPTTMPAGDMTVTAQWEIVTYTITYNLDGGSVDPANPTSYTIETPNFTLTTPTKPGYTFTGWTEGDDNTLLPTVTIEQGSTTDRTYTANYEFAQITGGDLSFVCTSGTEAKVTACNPSVTSVTIPATVSNNDGTYTVTAIDATAFSGCTGLLVAILESATPPTLGSGAFSGCTALNAIGVPAGTATAYKSDASWLDYAEKIHAIDGTCGTGVYYSYDGTTKTLSIFGKGAMTDYNGNTPWSSYREDITTVVIGHGVTSIGDWTFSGCTSLASIENPASVTSIGKSAFYNCTSLTSIVIPDGVTSIGELAFTGCSSLTSIEIPDGVTSIGKWTFYGCTSLSSIEIPDGVTSIGLNAFDGCTSLTSIEIPEGVTTIGDGAFWGCTSLTSIEIPASVTSISRSAFNGCTALKSISVASKNPNYDSRNDCNALIETETNWLIQGCNNTVIPDDVTRINTSAFWGCTGLTSITIPASVTEIGGDAFSGCTSLNTIILCPATPPTLGYNAFDGCTALNTIYVPSGSIDTYKSADGWADYKDKMQGYDGTCGTNVLYSYDSTKTLSIFGTGAMADYDGKNMPWNVYCMNITTVIIADGVTSIGNNAFSNCYSLTSIEIPDGVTSIGNSAFAGCSSLTSIEIPDGVTSIGDEAFYNCTSLTSIEIPASVTSIGNYAFEGCTSLNTLILYPATPPTLGSSAFAGCTALNTIYVPSGAVDTYKAAAGWSDYKDKIYAIDGTCGTNVSYSYDSTSKTLYIFGAGNMVDYDAVDTPWDSYCSDITKVVIAVGVTSIGNAAFSGCTGLNTLILYPATPPTLGSNAFAGCTALNTIYVPSGSIDTYKAADGWADYKDKMQGFDGCGTNVYYSYDGTTKTLHIFGTGAMVDYSNNQPWKDYCEDITTVVIDDGVTSIGNAAFQGCTSLTSIEIPDGVTSIGRNAFQGCTGLTSIEIPASVTSIGELAFAGCSSLTSIEIPDGVTSIGDEAFRGCTSLTSIEIPEGVTIIGECTFYNCSSLASIEIPDGVTSIGLNAFDGCSSLISITIPASVTSISESAFQGCTSLTSIDIPEGVTSIGNNTFEGCTSLESITIPASVTSIGDNAFLNCTSLTSIEILDGVTSIGNFAFYQCTSLTSITIPTSVTSIGNWTFAGSTSLTSIEISEGVTSIGGYAFGSCSSLTSVEIPASVTSIGENAFSGCSALESISVAAGNTVYDSRHDCNAIIEIETNTLIQGCKNTVIPDGPDGVTSIGDWAFVNCSSLTSIEIPASVTSIGIAAFENCTSLTSIEIPASVTSIGIEAFYGCTSLASVIICAPELNNYGDDAFFDNAEGRKIYVYNDCLETYKAQASWMGVDENDILAIESLVQRGDANADGNVSVTDIAVVVNCILQLDNTGGFSDYGADANGDGQVTVTDIGVIVDKILGTSGNAASRRLLQEVEPQ